MKTGDLVEPSEFFDGYFYTGSMKRPDWVGVVVKVLNKKMEPNLVEVAWTHGITLKHYSDDLKIMQQNVKKD